MPPQLPALSQQRVMGVLDRLGHHWQIDQDGDVAGTWETGYFFFLVRGEMVEILAVGGLWQGILAETDYLMAQELCNAWNEERLWPTAFVNRSRDDGAVRLRVNHAVDYEHGVTDDQIAQQMRRVIGSGLVLFDQAIEAFPDAWALGQATD